MTEPTAGPTMTGPPPDPRPEPPVVPDGALLGLLVLNGLLLGGIGLVFTPLHSGGVPVPMGAVLSILILPWLVLRAGEIRPRTAVAAAPLVAWLLVVGAVGLTGPGGDVILPATWQSALLVFGGLLAGLWALGRALAAGRTRG
ncbi:hypothetical protein [Pseudonocardia nigra]|jgi:hypothetical protein|uniref:hypothetical protein n=1 Tax=Pseudonocardia nigra TaxID=1921578 RepID=UPI001FE4A82D|nr:hypothetical protein [Pseudonocardia nigra]